MQASGYASCSNKAIKKLKESLARTTLKKAVVLRTRPSTSEGTLRRVMEHIIMSPSIFLNNNGREDYY